LTTQDPDGDSRKIDIVGLPAGEEGFWLGISDMNESSGTATLEGVPPRGMEGKVYPIVLIVTDATGRYATINSKLIIDGENRSPVIRGSATVKLAFDQSGNSKASDLASILATDFDGDTMTWSLSPLSAHKYGVPEVSGTGPRPTVLSYAPYGSQTADSFTIRVADAESYDELKVIPLIVASHSSIQVDFPADHDTVEAGTEYSNYVSLSGLSDYTVIDATLGTGPSWLKVSKISQGLFRLHGFVPFDVSGDFELQLVFAEAGTERGRESLVLKVSTSTALSIVLQGDDFVRLRKGSVFSEPGYEAKGASGEDLSGSVTFQGETDATGLGVHKLQYQVSDVQTGNVVSSTRFLQVSEGDSGIAVSSLKRLDPREVKGILPTSGNTLVWGEGRNGEAVSGNSNSHAFLSSVDSNGNSVAVEFFQSLSGQEINIEDCVASAGGCIFVVGAYKGNLGYRNYQIAAKGEHNVFIFKLDQDFGLIWSKTFSCTGKLGNLNITEFTASDILLGGSFSGSLSTEAGVFVSVAEKDLFVARMNLSNGMVSWLKRFGGSGDDSISALKSMGESIYLAGGVRKTGVEEYSFVFELDQNGVAVNSSSFKGLYKNQILDLAVGVDRIYLLGSFETSIELAGKTLSSSSSSAFALSLKSGLIQEWASLLANQDEPLGVETDAFGFPVFLTRFKNNSSIEGTSLNLVSLGQSDLLLAKLSKENGSFLWHKQLGGVGDENASDLKTDLHGKVFTLVHTNQSFIADGLASGAGSLFLATVESLQKPFFTETLDLNLTRGNSFFREINATAPSGFAQMQLMGAPSWVYLKDDRNGSGVIGGIVHPEANESLDFTLRAFDADGGYADLNVSCFILDNNQSPSNSNRFPSFSASIDLGPNVILSNVGDCESGKYLAYGKFTNTLKVGGHSAIATSGYDGFALKVDSQGQAEDLLHLASDDEVTPVALAQDDDGTIYLTGSFTGKLSVGFLEIESAGQHDIFVVSWSKTGDLLNLQSLGGPGDERSTSVIFLDGSLVVGGYFSDSFNFGQISQESSGGTDGFVMSVDAFDFQQINWFLPLAGSSDDLANVLEVSSNGSLYLGGSFGTSAVMGGVEIVSKGLSDAFVGKLTATGQVEFLRSGGGVGKDEVNFLGTARNGNLIVGGTFSEQFQWDSQKLSSKGAKDVFLGTLSTSGNCLTFDTVLVLGSFNGSIDLGEENPFLSRGGMDSFVAFYDHDLKSLSPGIRFGDAGDDVLLGAASVFHDNYILAGLSKGRPGQNLEYDLSGDGERLRAFLSVYGPAALSPKAWPEPPASAVSGSYFEYRFSSGPWPAGTDLDLTVRALPSFLRANLSLDGSGVVWGMVPADLIGVADSLFVDLSVNSKLYGKADVTFTASVIPSGETFQLVSESTSNFITQFETFSTTVRITGTRPQDVLLYPETLPPWIKGTRLDDSRYLLEGTPGNGHSGWNPVTLRASSSRFAKSFSFELFVQSPLGNPGTKTEFGDWSESWFGALILFENSWAYHKDLGWIYVESNEDGGALWFWTEKWGWTWTDQGHWNPQSGEGFLYSYKTGSWLYFKKGMDGSSNLVYLYDTGEWGYYESR
jgi:hypothetical protein